MEITVICYGEKRIWKSRKQAKSFYLEAMSCSEGSERERYAKIFCELESGMNVCTDEY